MPRSRELSREAHEPRDQHRGDAHHDVVQMHPGERLDVSRPPSRLGADHPGARADEQEGDDEAEQHEQCGSAAGVGGGTDRVRDKVAEDAPAGGRVADHTPASATILPFASVFQKWLVVGLIGLRVGRGERGDGTIERIVLTQGRPPIALRSPERAWPWASVQPQISPHTKRALVPSRTCAHDEVIGLPRLGRAETFSRRF